MSTGRELTFQIKGEVRALVVAEATFYLRAWDDEARKGVKAAAKRLFENIEPHATRFQDRSAKRPKKMARTATSAFLKSLDQDSTAVRLELQSGPSDTAAGPWYFDCQVDPDELDYSKSGWLRFSLPADQLEKDPAAFRALFLESSRLMRAQSAQGGFGVGFIPGYIEFPENSATQETIRGWVSRYRGLDLEDASSSMDWGGEQVKGAGWLTFLCNEFCERLEGRKEIRRRLSKAVELDELPNGIVLVAGDRPRLGDVNRAEDMSPYIEVARLLKPLRMDEALPLPGLDVDQTAAWFARFDKP